MNNKTGLRLTVLFIVAALIIAGCAGRNVEPTEDSALATAPSEKETSAPTEKETTAPTEEPRSLADADFVDLDLSAYDLEKYDFPGAKNNPSAMKIPQITIDTEGGREFNKRMQEFAQWIIGHLDAIQRAGGNYPLIDYEVFKTGDEYISVLIKSLDFESFLSEHSCATFDLANGKMLTPDEVIAYAGTKDEVIQDLERIIDDNKPRPHDTDQRAKNIFRSFEQMSLVYSWTKFYNLGSAVHQTQIESKDKPQKVDMLHPVFTYDGQQNGLKCFIAGENKIGVEFASYSHEGGGYKGNGEIKSIGYIENVKGSTIKELELNPVYEYLAQEAGIDPNSKDSPEAFSAFLGYKGGRDHIQIVIQNLFRKSGTPPFAFQAYNPGEDLPGDELYMLVGKYMKTTFGIYHRAEHTDEKYFTLRKYRGPNMVFIANKDIGDINTNIRIYHRDKMLDYIPQIDVLVNKNFCPEGIYDFSQMLDPRVTEISEDVEYLMSAFQ